MYNMHRKLKWGDVLFNFEYYFLKQLKMHPSLQFGDAIKLCYQAAFGAEHLLSDFERARAYLQAEFDGVQPTDEQLFEMISPDIARVNLGAWKREGRNVDLLFEAFKASAYVKEGAKELFMSYIDAAEDIMESEIPDFDKEKWLVFLAEYKNAGMPPVHHSTVYRESEKPAYRIVKIEKLEKIL